MKTMKTTKYLVLASTMLLTFAACSLDKEPYSSIPEDQALQSARDYSNMRVGLYSPLRGMNSGDVLVMQDIMGDNFNAVVGFSNTYGDLYTWTFTPETGYFETIYANNEELMNRANYILDNSTPENLRTILDASDDAETDSATIYTVIGEAYFIRAYTLYNLAVAFCADYDASTADNANSGVSYSLTYHPTSASASYPARATLNETYNQIASDLEQAKRYITADGEAGSAYVTKDVITALEARIALSKDDYTTAAQKAVEVINTGNYVLASDAETIAAIWQSDLNVESIWQLPVPSTSELPNTTGSHFLQYISTSIPDFIPSASLISLFTTADYRVPAYFTVGTINATNGASGRALLINKYPDHGGVWTALGRSESVRYMTEPKVIRIAEMYLIAAEAYARLGNVTEGAQYLNELETARIENYTERSFASADGLMQEIKNERRREMLCEGTYIFDLKRWGDGFDRDNEVQNMDFCIYPQMSNGTALSRPANFNRFTFPIPKHETDANPQVVQNPGY